MSAAISSINVGGYNFGALGGFGEDLLSGIGLPGLARLVVLTSHEATDVLVKGIVGLSFGVSFRLSFGLGIGLGITAFKHWCIWREDSIIQRRIGIASVKLISELWRLADLDRLDDGTIFVHEGKSTGATTFPVHAADHFSTTSSRTFVTTAFLDHEGLCEFEFNANGIAEGTDRMATSEDVSVRGRFDDELAV